MSTFRKIVNNTAIQACGSAFNTVTGLLVTAALARYLGKDGYGEYSLVFVYLFFAGVIADLGFDGILVRELAKVPDLTSQRAVSLISNTIIWKLVFSGLALAISAAYLFFRDYPLNTKLAVILLELTLFAGAGESLEAIFKVNLQIKYSVISSLISQGTHLFFLLLFIYLKTTLLVLIGAYFLARLVRCVVVYLFSTKFIRFRFCLDRSLMKFLFLESFPLGIAAGLWMVYYRVDTLMLDYYKGVGAVGQYNAAYKFVDLFLLFSGMIMVSIYPIMSATYSDHIESLKKLYQKSIDYLSIVGAFITFFTFIFAKYIITLIYGTRFLDSIPTLRILAWVGIFIFVSNIYGHMFIVLGLQKRDFLLLRFLGLVVNVFLNLKLIPAWGANGAAAATVFTEFLIFLLAPILIGNKFSYHPSFKNLFKSVGTAVFPCLLFLFVPFLAESIYPAIILFLTLSLLMFRRDYLQMWEFFKGEVN
ncbi:MAG: flippase [Candidatus Schekmanbacteria bacterium]|nr:flippase [Candidatus Schekmanbacteria bacterium]